MPSRQWLLFLILSLTLVRGVVYLAVIPPWQHYDEPTHFEYVRLIAERRALPGSVDYDLAMRREIASSMQAAAFWRDQIPPRIDFWSDLPPDIGVSELLHPPLYYILLALPQLPVASQGVELQLYLARLGSLVCYLWVIVSAYGLVKEAFPRRTMLPVAVATFIALLPPLTDLMSGVNNDAGAVAAVSLFLWATVRLVRRGPTPARVGATVLLAGICFITKSTAGVVALVALLITAAGYLPRLAQRWLWVGAGLMLLVLLAVSVTWGEHAAYWQGDDQPAPSNRVMTQAALGSWALVLSDEGQLHPGTLMQDQDPAETQNLQGHTVTFGAWLKSAGESGGLAVLQLDDGVVPHRYEVEATTDWQFRAYTATIDMNAPGVTVYALLPQDGSAVDMVYLDGVVLVDGEVSGSSPPTFDSAQATTGWWGQQPFTNLIRNGSAERTWPGLRTWIGNMTMYRYPIAHIFHSLWDWNRTGRVYVPQFSVLFQSFWGRFGWNHLALTGWYFWVLGLLTAAAMIGLGVALVSRFRRNGGRESWQWRVLIVLATTFLVGWGQTILRIHPVSFTEGVSWPVARYAAVVIVPTVTFLCLGWTEILPRRWVKEAAWVGLLGMIALDVVAFWTLIVPYYYG